MTKKENKPWSTKSGNMYESQGFPLTSKVLYNERDSTCKANWVKYSKHIKPLVEDMKWRLYYGKEWFAAGITIELFHKELANKKEADDKLTYIRKELNFFVNDVERFDHIKNNEYTAIRNLIYNKKFKPREFELHSKLNPTKGDALRISLLTIKIISFEYLINLYSIYIKVKEYLNKSEPYAFQRYMFESVFDCIVFAGNIIDPEIKKGYLKYCLSNLSNNILTKEKKTILKNEIEKEDMKVETLLKDKTKPKSSEGISVEKITWLKNKQDLVSLFDTLDSYGFVAFKKNKDEILRKHFTWPDEDIGKNDLKSHRNNLKNKPESYRESDEIKNIKDILTPKAL